MKHRIFSLMALGLMSVYSAVAQKGVMSAGVGISYVAGSQEDAYSAMTGLGANFRYNITDALRAGIGGTYYFKQDYTQVTDLNIDVNYLFTVARGLKLYPKAGAVVAFSKHDAEYYNDTVCEGESKSFNDLGLNVGAGIEYFAGDRWTIGLEYTFKYIPDYNRSVIGLGFGYLF